MPDYLITAEFQISLEYAIKQLITRCIYRNELIYIALKLLGNAQEIHNLSSARARLSRDEDQIFEIIKQEFIDRLSGNFGESEGV